MESLIVGSPDCKIHEIVGEIEKSPVVDQLNGKLSGIGLSLGVSTGTREKIKRKIIHFDEMSYIEGLSFFLEDWRSREVQNAKLTTFMEVLETQGLNEFASMLRKKYNKSENAKDNEDTDQKMTLVERQQAQITKMMPKLIEMTEWNATLKAIMRSKGILSVTDCKVLDGLANTAEKTEKLFTMIRDRIPGRPEIYDLVVEAFEGDQLCQSGVSSILKLKLD